MPRKKSNLGRKSVNAQRSIRRRRSGREEEHQIQLENSQTLQVRRIQPESEEQHVLRLQQQRTLQASKLDCESGNQQQGRRRRAVVKAEQSQIGGQGRRRKASSHGTSTVAVNPVEEQLLFMRDGSEVSFSNAGGTYVIIKNEGSYVNAESFNQIDCNGSSEMFMRSTFSVKEEPVEYICESDGTLQASAAMKVEPEENIDVEKFWVKTEPPWDAEQEWEFQDSIHSGAVACNEEGVYNSDFESAASRPENEWEKEDEDEEVLREYDPNSPIELHEDHSYTRPKILVSTEALADDLQLYLHCHPESQVLFQCPCSELFNSRKQLIGHVREHLRRPVFRCDKCPEMFFVRSSLRVHKYVVHFSSSARKEGKVARWNPYT